MSFIAPSTLAVPVQTSPYAGVECYDECAQFGLAGGLNVFWALGRVGALGALIEYVDTSGAERTGTLRFGPALRAYAARSTMIEPYLHAAAGVAEFSDKSAACGVEAEMFSQLAVGIDARVLPKLFVGGSFSATAQIYGVACGDVRDTNWDTGPTFGIMLTSRFGGFESDSP